MPKTLITEASLLVGLVGVTNHDNVGGIFRNAAAFVYTVNGVPGRALGASGEVVEFQMTRENVHTYRR